MTDLPPDRSDDIGSLALALATAQGEIRSALKDSVNPHLKSKYADLANVWDAIRAPLSKNKLAVVQLVSAEGDAVSVTSTLCHESGQWMRGTLTLKAPKVDPQGVGSAITYARRYALSALVGVAQDDDDGHAASLSSKNQAAGGRKVSDDAPTQNQNARTDQPQKAESKPIVSAAYEAFVEKAKLVFDRAAMGRFLKERNIRDLDLKAMTDAQLAALAEEFPRPQEATAIRQPEAVSEPVAEGGLFAGEVGSGRPRV